MRLNQIIHLLSIALFLGAFQITTIHSKHQSIETITECKVCEFTKHNTLTPHQTRQSLLLENVAIPRDTKKSIACVRIKNQFIYKVTAHTTPIKTLQIDKHNFKTPPLGYDATAPPLFS